MARTLLGVLLRARELRVAREEVNNANYGKFLANAMLDLRVAVSVLYIAGRCSIYTLIKVSVHISRRVLLRNREEHEIGYVNACLHPLPGS